MGAAGDYADGYREARQRRAAQQQTALHDTVRVLLADLPDSTVAVARLIALRDCTVFTDGEIRAAVEAVYPERIGTATNRETGVSRKFYSDKKVEALRNG